MKGKIIILHGPSSSGKSTTAGAIQALAELPFWHLSIDHLRDSGVLPTERLRCKDFFWSDLRKPFFDGFHASLAAYANAGNSLIVEHILDEPEWVTELKSYLAPFDVFFVGIHCGLTELRRRERERGNRRIGSAEQDFHNIHTGRVYDLEIDGQENANQNAKIILDRWRSGLRQSEFSKTPRATP